MKRWQIKAEKEHLLREISLHVIIHGCGQEGTPKIGEISPYLKHFLFLWHLLGADSKLENLPSMGSRLSRSRCNEQHSRTESCGTNDRKMSMAQQTAKTDPERPPTMILAPWGVHLFWQTFRTWYIRYC